MSSPGRNVTSHLLQYLHVRWTFNHPGQITFPLRQEAMARTHRSSTQLCSSLMYRHPRVCGTDTYACFHSKMFEAADAFPLIPVNTIQ